VYFTVDLTAPYVLAPAAGLPPGHRELEIRAYDQSLNVGLASLSLEVDAECGEGMDSCGEGLECLDGRCLGSLGVECNAGAECASQQCAAINQFDHVCSQACSASAACPSGFSCQASGIAQNQLCLAADGGGGCAITYTNRRGNLAGILASLLMLGILWTRGKKPRR
jgi:hypothetical protein